VSLVSSSCSTPSIPSPSDGCQRLSSLQCSKSLPDIPATATVNVKFAPLPKREPGDVRSIRPLGVAARSRMLHQKKEIRMQGVQRHSSVWPDLDEDRHMDFVPDEAEEEDSLEVLGRFIAAKSKSLWRRVSSKGKQPGKDGVLASEVPTDGEARKPLAQSRAPNREQLPPPSEPLDEARETSKTEMVSMVVIEERAGCDC